MLEGGRFVHVRVALDIIVVLALTVRLLARGCPGLKLSIVNFKLTDVSIISAEEAVADRVSVWTYNAHVHTLLLAMLHLKHQTAVKADNGLLVLLEPLLQLLGLVQHDPGIVRKTPLFLVAALADVMGAIVFTICGTCSCAISRGRATFTTSDAQTLIATVAACARGVMVLSEYLRYVLAGDWPD